jgi:hypothetical protein
LAAAIDEAGGLSAHYSFGRLVQALCAIVVLSPQEAESLKSNSYKTKHYESCNECCGSLFNDLIKNAVGNRKRE